MGQLAGLANQYVSAAMDLDQLYADLVSNGQYGLANQVSDAENKLKKAATDLFSLDASIALTDPNDVNTITTLTDAMSTAAANIAAAEDRVTVVTGIAASLVAIPADFMAGNTVGAIGAATQAITSLGKL